jgi:hypothetical protein
MAQTDFLTLLTAQLKSQDPFNPMDNARSRRTDGNDQQHQRHRGDEQVAEATISESPYPAAASTMPLAGSVALCW